MDGFRHAVRICAAVNMMEGMGWMMGGMGLFGILLIVLLILGIAALLKFLFRPRAR